MDANRFDELSKALATGALSRRALLRRAVAVGAAAAGASFFRGDRAARAAPAQTPPAQAPPDGTCVVTRQNGHEVYTVSSVSADGQLTLSHRLDVATAQAGPTSGTYGPDTCVQGYVWREATPADHVCVTPDVRTQTAADNAKAAQRRNPAGGPSGPDTCLQGYVWREAVPGDHVCVTPQTRQQAADDNSHAQVRRQGGAATAPTSLNPKPPTMHTSRLTISRQGTSSPPLFQIDSTGSAAGASQITLQFGTAFQGVKQAIWSSSDGVTFQGMIDGKPTMPFQAGADPSSIQFTDGSPLPALTVDSALQASMTRLLSKANNTALSCRGAATSPASVFAYDRLASVPTVDQLTTNSAACNQCHSTCGAASLVCDAGAAAACIFTLGFGCAAAAYVLIACGTTALGCEASCYIPGRPCCPTFCPGHGDICCAEGNTCVGSDPYTNCCPPDKTVCNDRCCDSGESCFDNTCCRTAEQACNGVCCPAGQVCADRNQKVCCPSGSGPVCGATCCSSSNQHCEDASSGLCCGPGEVKFGNGCCPPANMCGTVCCSYGTCIDAATSNCCSGFGTTPCGSACCDPDSLCVGGACCPRDQACAGVCCPSGQVCDDPNAGTCKASDCLPGQVHTFCQSASGPATSVCCPPDAGCCAGQCCSRGESCCVDPLVGAFTCSPNCIH